jgi:hypothetical protein
VVVAKGCSAGVSRVAETASLPGDPDNSSRDDQVFPGGSMHIVSLVVDFLAVLAALIDSPPRERKVALYGCCRRREESRLDSLAADQLGGSAAQWWWVNPAAGTV